MRPGPGDILGTYQRQAEAFAAARRSFPEAAVIAAALRRQRGRRVLDLGCGSGRPVGAFLLAAGCRVTAVDGAAAMAALARAALPGARVLHADMRRLRLRRRFDLILAWDSFFHLAPADQRAMFATFAAHAAPGCVLLLNTGGAAGSAIGRAGAEPVWHGSLAPGDYRRLLALTGWQVEAWRRSDPLAGGRFWWRARRVTKACARPGAVS